MTQNLKASLKRKPRLKIWKYFTSEETKMKILEKKIIIEMVYL